jgi:GNAT superfamily N-acetyltransferase
MPSDEPRKFNEDVFPAELTEIHRRRWKISRDYPLEDGKLEDLPPLVKGYDDAEKKLHVAEKPAPLARAMDAILGWVRAIFPKGKIKQAVTDVEDIRADVEIKRRALAKQCPPSVRNGLVGLAFSGGGIRSATFNLGILQSLADLGILRFFDYLSTVSGGGYIGSWFSAWIWNEQKSRCGGFGAVETQLKPALSARRRGEEKCPPIATVAQYPPECGPDPIFHLRRYSNYLTPRLGAFSQDTWSAIAIYVRNLLLIQLMLIPALAAVLLLPRLLVKAFFEVSPEFCLWLLLLALLILMGIVLGAISSALNHLRDPDDQKHFHLGELQYWICIPVLAASVIFSWLFGAQKNHLQTILEPLRRLRSYFSSAPVNGLLGTLPVHTYAFVYWGLALGLLNLVVYFICAAIHDGKFRRARIFSDFVSGFVGGVLLYTLSRFGLWEWGPWNIVSFGPPLFLIIFLLAVTVQVGLRSVTETDAAREWRASMGAWLLIYALFWAVLFAISFYGPLGWEYLGEWAKTKTTLITAWLGSTLAAVFAGKSPSTGTPGKPSKLEWVVKIGPVIAVLGLLIAVATVSHKIVTRWSPPSKNTTQPEKPAPPAVQPKTIQAEFAGTVQLNAEPTKIDVNLKLGETPKRRDLTEEYRKTLVNAKTGTILVLIGLCGVIVVILANRVDVNEFSLHAFYRNRLVRCYLGASRGGDRKFDPITGFDPKDDFALAKLRPGPDYQEPLRSEGAWVHDGPYLIINTALNQMAGKELAWQQRKATSFVLTPRFCGSGETDYQETGDFCGSVELGTAFAISGAAASPNMGYHSSGPMAFLLTLFNVRMGWWVRNPKWNGKRGGQRPVRFHYLLTELLGQTTADSSYVYLSDGGHFENLGIYELVRRRCKYIVCCDAGADSLAEFEDLGNAIRKIRSDLGINIEIDLDMVRPQAGQRFSRWHQAIGTIRYDQVDSNESVGLLVYIKSSLTGDESGDLLEHAGRHLAFPHDPTVDQFFDESQFESYRKLGEHVGWEVFRCAQDKAGMGADAIFSALRHYWVTMPISLRDSFLGQQEALLRLEARLRDDPQLQGYDLEIYPEIVSLLGANPTALAAADERAALHFFNMQLDLMENIFLALELEKYHAYAMNRGWMNLFRRWATTPTFQKLWPGLRGSFSRHFAEFVEGQLLPGDLFQIVNTIQQALVQPLLDEFDRDLLSRNIAQQFPSALKAPLTFGGGAAAAWSVVPKGSQASTEAWGVAVAAQGPQGYACQLYVWVRGAYRNLGMGGRLLDEALRGLKQMGFTGKILVDLGADTPGNPSYQQRKAAWLRMYGKHGFVREFSSGRLQLTLTL